MAETHQHWSEPAPRIAAAAKGFSALVLKHLACGCVLLVVHFCLCISALADHSH